MCGIEHFHLENILQAIKVNVFCVFLKNSKQIWFTIFGAIHKVKMGEPISLYAIGIHHPSTSLASLLVYDCETAFNVLQPHAMFRSHSSLKVVFAEN